MVALNIAEGLTLVELMIYGFIGFNLTVAGGFLVFRSFKRLTAAVEVES